MSVSMKVIRGIRIGLGAVTALSLVALAPLTAATLNTTKKSRVTVQAVPLTGFGAFTPATGDPRRAAAFARSGLGSTTSFNGGAFRFTPSGNPGSRRAVTVAVRARANTRAEVVRTTSLDNAAITPSAYNLGVSVGWRRFALSGDVAKIEGSLLPDNRESAEIGLTYSGNKWNTRLEVGADRATGDRPSMISRDETYSVGLGGSYSLSRNIAVTGGVRYKLQRDRLDPMVDERRDSQAVYIGTAFRF
jgi:hypothetical protein